MLFPNKQANIQLPTSAFWTSDWDRTKKIVRGRKYLLKATATGFTIERKVNTVFDTMALVVFKRLCFAEGEIEIKEHFIDLSLSVKLKPFYEIAFVSSLIFWGMVNIYTYTLDWQFGLLFSGLLVVIFTIHYFAFKHGVTTLLLDLEYDLKKF